MHKLLDLVIRKRIHTIGCPDVSASRFLFLTQAMGLFTSTEGISVTLQLPSESGKAIL